MRITLAFRILPLLLVPVLLPAPAAWSQPRGGMGRPEGPPPSAKRRLEHWLGSVDRLQHEGQLSLDKSQAKRLVALISPWKKKPTMTQAQAQKLGDSLNKLLNAQQEKVLDRALRDRPRRGEGPRHFGLLPGQGFDGGPPGLGRPPGPPPGAPPGEGWPRDERHRPSLQEKEAGRRLDETLNPFASPKLNAGFSALPQPFQERALRRYQRQEEFLKSLSAKTK